MKWIGKSVSAFVSLGCTLHTAPTQRLFVHTYAMHKHKLSVLVHHVEAATADKPLHPPCVGFVLRRSISFRIVRQAAVLSTVASFAAPSDPIRSDPIPDALAAFSLIDSYSNSTSPMRFPRSLILAHRPQFTSHQVSVFVLAFSLLMQFLDVSVWTLLSYCLGRAVFISRSALLSSACLKRFFSAVPVYVEFEGTSRMKHCLAFNSPSSGSVLIVKRL